MGQKVLRVTSYGGREKQTLFVICSLISPNCWWTIFVDQIHSPKNEKIWKNHFHNFEFDLSNYQKVLCIILILNCEIFQSTQFPQFTFEGDMIWNQWNEFLLSATCLLWHWMRLERMLLLLFLGTFYWIRGDFKHIIFMTHVRCCQ